MFLVLFKNGEDDFTRNSFDEYYVSLVVIKDINEPVNNKSLFWQSVKDKLQVYDKLVGMPRNAALTKQQETYHTWKLL